MVGVCVKGGRRGRGTGDGYSPYHPIPSLSIPSRLASPVAGVFLAQKPTCPAGPLSVPPPLLLPSLNAVQPEVMRCPAPHLHICMLFAGFCMTGPLPRHEAPTATHVQAHAHMRAVSAGRKRWSHESLPVYAVRGSTAGRLDVDVDGCGTCAEKGYKEVENAADRWQYRNIERRAREVEWMGPMPVA